MRIVGGEYGGRTIVPPRNLRARPTTDFAKENLFNVLQNKIEFEDVEVLDLFAGTGSISYEFVSRGARSVTSVELNPIHERFIRKTAEELGMKNLYVVKANAYLYLKRTKKQYDVIFSDAPYDDSGREEVIELVFSRNLLKAGGVLIYEHSGKEDYSGHAQFIEERKYESVHFTLFEERKFGESKEDKKSSNKFVK